MSRYWRRIPMIGAFFLLTAYTNGQDAKKEAPPPSSLNYYPLEVGNEWNYRLTANNKSSSVVIKIAKIDEQNAALLESPTVNATEHVMQSDKGVFRSRFNGAEVTPPLRLLPYPAKPGEKWEGEFSIAKSSGKHKYTGEIQKEETVAVPAGKFTALRVLIKLEQNGMIVETTYWFVKDVGFVKQSVETTGNSILLELEKFEKKK